MKCHLGLLAAVIACGDNHGGTVDAAMDAEVTPLLRNPVTLTDSALAVEAATLLGACNDCHGITRQRVRYWRALTSTATSECFTDLAVETDTSARRMADCMRMMPDVATSDFSAVRLGIYAMATHLPWFRYTFARAYGGDADAQHADLQQQAGMPRGGTPLSQEQFDIVAEWFARGTPRLDDVILPGDPPAVCTPNISSAVPAHIAAMATTGWRIVNRTNGLAMHGCGAATDPRDCLATVPRAVDQAYGATWLVPGRGDLRVLLDVAYASAYWTRGSPDGRFITHGVADVAGSYVHDLQRGVQVPITAELDPAFFPDNSGFAFHGSNRNLCAMSVLTSNPSQVTMDETGCTRILGLGEYENLGKLLGGGDYTSITGQFVTDDGGKLPTLTDPAAAFTTSAYLDFTPMMFDGSTFVARVPIRIALPYEGDSVMSPSATLVMLRMAGANDAQLGYVLRQVIATPSSGTYDIVAPDIARYCTTGGKPAFSFDERWVVFHRYVTAADAQELGFAGAGDPAFAPYLTAGAANLYLMDLATGVPLRFTNMAPGQYALFPHFRSDGWIYAQVRDRNANREYTIASDAALVAE